jgi:GNAT superfamily N-acetyltransferase
MTESAIEVSIREFIHGDERAFRELNEAWIGKYFVLEPKDVSTLADPKRNILDHGGHIYLAVRQGEVIGCCTLVAIGPNEFEIGKMSVAEPYRRGGVGRQLLDKVISEARRLGARRLYLETNAKLTPAIRLYEAVGFRHIPSERVVPSPYARANVYMELSL